VEDPPVFGEQDKPAAIVDAYGRWLADTLHGRWWKAERVVRMECGEQTVGVRLQGSRYNRAGDLEAILAHELAHHLPLPRRVSLFLYWLSLPARAMGIVLAAGLQHRAFKTLIRIVIGFFTAGCLRSAM
jgi:hypothetical protein